MKKIDRWIALVLAVGMMGSMTACTQKPAKTDNASGQDKTTVSSGMSTESSKTEGAQSDDSGSGASADQEGSTVKTQQGQTIHTTQGGNGTASSKPDISSFVIVRGAKATRVEQRAATDLQSYLKKIFGVTLQIVTDASPAANAEFLIGSTNRSLKAEQSKLKDDGFEIRREGNRIAIGGTTDQATMYGIYYFLEQYLGCRFYTADVEKIPTAKTLNLPSTIRDVQNPALTYRDTSWYGLKDPVFAAKMRINSDHDRKGSTQYGTGMHYAGGQFVHTMNFFLPKTSYFGSHPEYFALVNGKRDPAQPCLSNPEVQNIIQANVMKLLESDPDADIVSVSQNDNPSFCTCDKCKAINHEEGTNGGTIFRFVNKIAAAVKKKYPNVKVDTLAYMYSRRPGKTVPADNVIIRLCSFECCFSHPLGDGGCSANSGFASDMTAWSKKTSQIYVWDYTTDFYYSLLTYPNFHVLADNIKYMRAHHVNGIFEQGNSNPDGEFGDLRAYLLCKLLWNPNADTNALTDDFLKNVYGAGWQSIKQYITKYEALVKNLGTHAGIYVEVSKLLPYSDSRVQSFVKEGVTLWDNAQAKATGDQLARVKRARLQMDFIRQCVTASSELGTAAWLTRNQNLLDAIRKEKISFRENGMDIADPKKSPTTWFPEG